MTLDEIYDTLASAGVVKVAISFYGGGDEGHIDSIVYTTADEGECDIRDIPHLMAREQDPEDDFSFEYFEGHIEDLVTDRICFDGCSDVSGSIELDVPFRKGTLEHAVTEYVDQPTEHF